MPTGSCGPQVLGGHSHCLVLACWSGPGERRKRSGPENCAGSRVLQFTREPGGAWLMPERDQVEINGGDATGPSNALQLEAVSIDAPVLLGEIVPDVHSVLVLVCFPFLAQWENTVNDFFPIEGIPTDEQWADHTVMDNKTIRNKNLRWLIDQHGGTAAFAEVIGKQQVQVSQLKGGKPMGDRLAREIEAAMGVASGWLDTPRWPDPSREPTTFGAGPEWDHVLNPDGTPKLPPPSQSQDGRFEWRKVVITATALRIVLARRGVSFNIEDPEDAEIFVEAYALLEAIPNADTPEGGIDFGAKVADLVAVREARRNGSRSKQASGSDRTPFGEQKRA